MLLTIQNLYTYIIKNARFNLPNQRNYARFNLHPNKYSQELHYYSFTNKLDQYVGSCNTLNDLSNKVCVPNKTTLKSKRVEHDYRKNELKKAFNKAYIIRM